MAMMIPSLKPISSENSVNFAKYRKLRKIIEMMDHPKVHVLTHSPSTGTTVPSKPYSNSQKSICFHKASLSKASLIRSLVHSRRGPTVSAVRN